MAILKATNISPNNTSIDATNDLVVSWKNNGDRQYSYEVKIYNNSTSALAYSSTKISSFNAFHTVPAMTLINGTNYKMQILTYNQLDEFSTSDWVLFKASSTPVTTITNISEGGDILNNSYLFNGTYSQAESVPIKSWQFILYDSFETIISTSGENFNSNIEYEFSGFENNRSYKIELQTKSQDNLLSTSGKIGFNINYETPKLAVILDGFNNNDLGAIELNARVVQITGDGENYSYITSNKVDLTNGNVIFNSGFDIESDFTNELWVESVSDIQYNINNPTNIVLFNIPPLDTGVVWIDSDSQTTEVNITPILSPTSPSEQLSLWVEDTTQLTAYNMTSSIDIIKPTTELVVWTDISDGNSFDSEIYVMENNNGDVISLRYHNSSFHLYENDALIDSVPVTATKYYIYVQQINGVLTFNAIAND